MDSLVNVISDLRTFLYGGMNTLPLTLAGTFLIFGLFSANYAILFFLVGYLLAVPIVVNLILNPLFTLLTTAVPSLQSVFEARGGDICGVRIPFRTMQNTNSNSPMIGVSTWTSMIFFLIGYIATNSITLLNRKSPQNSFSLTTSSESDVKEDKSSNRTTQSIISIATIIIVSLIIVLLRYQSGCNTVFDLLFSGSFFVYMGHLWYKWLSSFNEDRIADLFGIANRLLPPSAISNHPIACIPPESI